jgi:hypothetical protein
MEGFSKIDSDSLQENLIKLILTDQMVITAGTPEKFDSMPTTWTLFGHVWQNPTALIFLCPQGYMLPYIDSHSIITLSFFL